MNLFGSKHKWFKHPYLHNVINRCWTGFNDFAIRDKLQVTADTLNLWRRHVALAFRRNKEELEQKIGDFFDRTDSESALHLSEALVELAKLLISEKTHWKQRAKVFWLKDGD